MSLSLQYLLGVFKDQKHLNALNLLIIREGAKRAAVRTLEAEARQRNGARLNVVPLLLLSGQQIRPVG